MTVSRFDVVALDRTTARRDASGFLTVSARLSRSGVQEYRRADGSIRREYRPPSEVFDASSLASAALKPITLGHPAGLVTPETARRDARGTIGQDVRQHEDGRHVAASLTVWDAETLAAIESGIRQISLGYTVTIDETPGEIDGEEYDAIQRGITINHAAILPRGRAGTAEIQDSAEALRLDGADAAAPELFPAEAPKDHKMKIKIDGENHDVDPAVAAHLESLTRAATEAEARADKAEADKAAEVAEAKAAADRGDAEADSLRARCDTLADRIKEIEAGIDSRVDARAELTATAARVLDGYSCRGKSDDQIRADVAKSVLPSLADKIDGASADYVRAMFDMAIEDIAKREDKKEALIDRARDAVQASGSEDSGDLGESANRKAIEDAFQIGA